MKWMDFDLNNGVSVDIQKIMKEGFDLKEKRHDIIDIVSFLCNYDLEVITKLMQMHEDGNKTVNKAFRAIKNVKRTDKMALRKMANALTVCARGLEHENRD
jgi:hypothetical protein